MPMILDGFNNGARGLLTANEKRIMMTIMKKVCVDETRANVREANIESTGTGLLL